MQADLKVAIGFMSRWSILGLSGLFVLWVGFILFDPAGLASIQDTQLVIPDFVIPADKSSIAWGFHTTRVKRGPLLSLSGEKGSWPIRGISYGKRVAIKLPAGPEGTSAIQTVGSAYGPTAFYTHESLVHRAAKGSRVFLIDAQAIVDSDQLSDFGAMLGELSQVGDVAIFCQGPFDQYPQLRDRLRNKVGPVPAVYLARRQSRIDPWQGSARSAIGAFDKAGASRIDLITTSPLLAAEVAKFAPFYRRTDVRIHLVNPPAGHKKVKSLELHDNWVSAVRDISSPPAQQDPNQPASEKSK